MRRSTYFSRDGGASDDQLAEARDFQRKASFYIDFVEAENSSGFHAGQEGARILGEAINFCRLGQLALRDGQEGGGLPVAVGPGPASDPP